jgi:hypothetical protein
MIRRLYRVLRPWLTVPGLFALGCCGYDCYALTRLVVDGRWGEVARVVVLVVVPVLLVLLVEHVLRRVLGRRLIERALAGTSGPYRDDLLDALAESSLVGPALVDEYRAGR